MASGAQLLGSEGKNVLSVNGVTAAIPMPIQIVIDDVGWWSGNDGSEQQQPYRTGIARNHVPADYQAIVDLGRALGIRPQAAMVLCEWDKENILRTLPTSTWMGENWNNDKWVGPWLEEAADIITSNQQHYEFTIHGIGHEYWAGTTFTRAEWAERDGTMRPRDQVERHLDYFAAIMQQNQLGDFPHSFVPTAFCHGFGPTDGHDVSMAQLLKQRGVTYINSPFSAMANSNAAEQKVFGFDAGVMTVDRGNDLLDWNVIGRPPVGTLHGSTCGMHWPNLLHADPERNSETVQAWVKLLAPYNEKMDTMLAPNSVFFQHQLAHQVCTKPALFATKITLDFSETDRLDTVAAVGKKELTLKVKSDSELIFTSDAIKIKTQSSKREHGVIVYTLELERFKDVTEATLNFRAA